MTPFEALDILKPVHNKKIKTVYDRGDFAEAIATLLPDFEYPDWDFRPVGELVKHFIDGLPKINIPASEPEPVEECLEDFEKQLGKNLTQEMCSMATERLIRDWGGYAVALETILDWLEMDLGSMDADIEDGDDEAVLPEERAVYEVLHRQLKIVIRIAKKVDAVHQTPAEKEID